MTPAHWRDQIGPERDERPEPADYPRADDGPYTQTSVHPADRAIREWQQYLADLPWWKRAALKLWYSL